jgi:predicted nucleic acid-binding protein
MERLETKNIAFDAQFIIEQNFLEGNLIKEFSNQAKIGRIKLYLTDIVYREVLSHFKIHLNLAKSKNINKQSEKIYVLRHFERYRPYFTLPEIDINTCFSEFKEMFDNWIRDYNVTIVSSELISIKNVIDDYFERRPPFEDAKKSEFPDAFTLEALKFHFISLRKKCYLISSDEGISKYQDDILLTKKEGREILELILREFQEDGPIAFIEKKFEEKRLFIVEKCKIDLKEAVKNSILSAYTIDGRLIRGIEKLDITIIDISDLYVIKLEGSEFSLIATVYYVVQAEVALLSSALSTGFDVNYTLRPNETGSIEIIKSLSVDLVIDGEYNSKDKSIIFQNYSLSPMYDVIDGHNTSR